MHTKQSENTLSFRNKLHRFSLAASFLQTGLRPILVLVLVTISASMLAYAQETWQVDPQLSIARLSLGSESNALEIGLARVSGEVVFKSSDSADPLVHLVIKPDNGPQPSYAELSFTSKRSATTSDGKVVVTGDLSVTRVERSVTIEPNEAYHGPDYGEPVVQTTTEEVRLVISDPRWPATGSNTKRLSGSSSFSREAFPQLMDALTRADWPTILVNGEKCHVPSTIGEDYSGATCSGTVIATLNNSMVSTGSGEAYYGFQPAVTPDRERGTIALDLKVKPTSSVSAAVASVPTAARE